MSQPNPKHKSAIVERARELGFDCVGVADATRPLEQDFERYQRFVAQGYHGNMAYLESHPEARRRLDDSHILPGARSVICLARRYGRGALAEANDPPLAQLVARYARGQDYHNFLRKKLRKLAAFVRTLEPGTQARPLLDEEPILERAWAARAGLGFVGKNGLLIVPGEGSFVLLGEVVTTLPLAEDAPQTERCGSCRLCLDACPTQALVAPFVLDATRCIAYRNIEDREGEREGIGAHLFGCDDCQTVCPFNRTRPGDPASTRPFEPLPRWAELGLADLEQLDEAQFAKLTEGSPLHRATREGLARSARRVRETLAGHAEPAAAVRPNAAKHAPGDHES